MRPCIIGFGSNEGDSPALFRAAARMLADSQDLRIVAASSLYASTPAGGPADQPEFLNAALLIETARPAEALLDELLDIELRLGRARTIRWGPRTLDLDLLIAGDEISATSRLTLPHPRFMVRRFAVFPAAEIAPRMRLPTLFCNLRQLRNHLSTTPRSVWLAGGSPTFCEGWRAATHAQLPTWLFPEKLPNDADQLRTIFPPRFLALAADSLQSDSPLTFPMPIPRVTIEATTVESAATEVVAHCIASDTILECRAGPEWLSL